MKGIDAPAGLDEDWRPSIMEHLRHARIAMAFAERQAQDRAAPQDISEIWPDWRKRFNPAQLEQVKVMREAFRRYRHS